MVSLFPRVCYCYQIRRTRHFQEGGCGPELEVHPLSRLSVGFPWQPHGGVRCVTISPYPSGVPMKIVRIANTVLDTINRLLEYLIGTLMLVLVVITFTEVVRRYVFNDPTHWASEFCRFLLIWMTFTGAAIVTRLVAHLTMGFTIHRFVGKVASRTVKVLVSATVAT